LTRERWRREEEILKEAEGGGGSLWMRGMGILKCAGKCVGRKGREWMAFFWKERMREESGWERRGCVALFFFFALSFWSTSLFP